MHAGELRTPIDIYKKTTSGTGGFKTQSYEKELSTRCRWVNAHGKDSVIASSDQVEKMATVTMRYSSKVTESCRVKMGGLTYEIITGIDNIRDRNHWIEFKVRAVVTA